MSNIILRTLDEAYSVILRAWQNALSFLSKMRVLVDVIRERIKIKIIIASTVIEYYLEAAASVIWSWVSAIEAFVSQLLGNIL